MISRDKDWVVRRKLIKTDVGKKIILAYLLHGLCLGIWCKIASYIHFFSLIHSQSDESILLPTLHGECSVFFFLC